MFDPRIWHSRGYLPHVDPNGVGQFITFRLADSLPQKVLNQWRKELASGNVTDADHRRRIETYLDQNYGSAVLRDARIAEMIQDTLLKWDGERYRLHAWVIMPNHVHLMLHCLEGYSLAMVMHAIKSYTAHEANRILERKGRLWSREYFDRYIRGGKHYVAVIRYIEQNPVKAGMCGEAKDWRYSSAQYRES